MTTAVENKMYELITKGENFDFAFDLCERFDSITERVIQEFWDEFILKIKKESLDCKFTNRSNTNQHLDITIKPFNKVLFYVGIYDYEFQYGISITHKGNKKEAKEIADRFEDVFEQSDPKQNVSWFFETGEEDFESLFGLKKILPENRTLLIDKYIRDFKSMVESKNEVFSEFEGISI